MNQHPPSWQIWLLACRPKTLTAAAVPVMVGAGVAWSQGGFRFLPVLAALLTALMIQIGTNFANDVYDFERGADNDDRVGPQRAVASGLLTPASMRRGMIIAFGLAVVGGVYLVAVGGWPLVVIGVASITSGIAYTGGPFPLGYNGLGDLFVMVFFGFVAVCGTVYVQMASVPALAWWASVPIGALSTAILVVNNVRDRVTDATAGKRTLVVRFGRRSGEIEYALLLAVAYAIPLILVGTRLGGAQIDGARPWALLLPLLTAPAAYRLLLSLRRREGPELNPLLGQTGALLLIFGILFALGLALSNIPAAPF